MQELIIVVYKYIKCLTIGTVFSGIGAFEYALKRLRIPYKLIFAADNNVFVRKSYLKNYEVQSGSWFSDIRHIDGTLYRDQIDILVGGPPCQSFSRAGNQKGFEDSRGKLIFDYLSLIKNTAPKIFLFENVKALLTNDNGQSWTRLKNELNTLDYYWKYCVLNARDFGIPQQRERVFIIGFKDYFAYQEFQFPTTHSLKIGLNDLLEDHLHYFPDSNMQNLASQFGLLGDFFLKSSNIIPTRYFLSTKMIRYVTSKSTGNFNNNFNLCKNVANTLVASMHKMHRASIDNYIVYGPRLRRLTARESLRLMGFDDRFEIVVSDMQMYRQAGNSIVVDVLISLIIEIAKVCNCINLHIKRNITQNKRNMSLTDYLDLLKID